MMRNLKHTITTAAMLAITMVVYLSGRQALHAQTHRSPMSKSHHKSYKCSKVGKQKVHGHKFTKKELKGRKEFVHGPSRAVISEMLKKREEQAQKELIAKQAKMKKAKEEPVVIEASAKMPLPDPVFFIFDSDELEIVDKVQIELAVRHMQNGAKVHLQGHTDNEGTQAYNLKLSAQRAEKIKRMMLEIDDSIDPTKITTEGKGEVFPLYNNDTKDHRLHNRRVEFKIK